MRSRTWKNQTKGVYAPKSIPVVPSHTRCEMSRIISHLVWLGTAGIDLGAYTPFLWSFQERERIYNLQEAWTGARLTTSLTRVGGLMADIPDGWESGLREFTSTFPKTLSEVDTMFTRNAIWIGRTQGVG